MYCSFRLSLEIVLFSGQFAEISLWLFRKHCYTKWEGCLTNRNKSVKVRSNQ